MILVLWYAAFSSKELSKLILEEQILAEVEEIMEMGTFNALVIVYDNYHFSISLNDYSFLYMHFQVSVENNSNYKRIPYFSQQSSCCQLGCSEINGTS